ncbi:hypothetical protein EON83_25835 [bacterium]|nr:MAG: hypothetical protein EON83_25835 [bacterium]
MRQIKPAIALAVLSVAVAAGQTVVNSALLDTSSGDSCSFLLTMGAIAANGVVVVKLQGGNLADGSDMADILPPPVGSGQTAPPATLTLAPADANSMQLLEVHRPTTKYIRVVLTRTVANSDVVAIHGLVYGLYFEPAAQPGISQSLLLVTPPVSGAVQAQ